MLTMLRKLLSRPSAADELRLPSPPDPKEIEFARLEAKLAAELQAVITLANKQAKLQ